jgi:hypothetical protein
MDGLADATQSVAGASPHAATASSSARLALALPPRRRHLTQFLLPLLSEPRQSLKVLSGSAGLMEANTRQAAALSQWIKDALRRAAKLYKEGIKHDKR